MFSIHLRSDRIKELARLCESRMVVPCFVGPSGDEWLAVFSGRLEFVEREADRVTCWLSRQLGAVAIEIAVVDKLLRLLVCEGGQPTSRFPEDWYTGAREGKEALLGLCVTQESKRKAGQILEAQAQEEGAARRHRPMPTWDELEAIAERRLAELEAMTSEEQELEWEQRREHTAEWRAVQISEAMGIALGHLSYDDIASPEDMCAHIPAERRGRFVHIE